MHHPSHHPSHSQQGEVLFGDVGSHLIHVPHTRKEKTAEPSDEQGWRKGSSYATRSVGSRCGKDFGEQHQSDVDDQQARTACEQRVVHYSVPIGFRVSIEQDIQRIVALTI